MTDINALVADRKKTHGKYDDHARIAQRLKAVITDELIYMQRVDKLSHTQRESIEMILHKIGRIVAGDASFADHWDDIAGYAKIANGAD